MYRSGRRNWRKGAWLVEDEESGVVSYSTQITRDYLGNLVRKQYADSEHPQDFVRGLNDPKALPFMHPIPVTSHICNYSSVFIGNTNVTASRDGPADHLFEASGIGSMSLGCSFIIYPEST
jgi:hypothetical protein